MLTPSRPFVAQVRVGVYFDMLRYVDDAMHTFDAEFFTVYMWSDPRNYSLLFLDDQLVDVQTNFNSTGARRRLASRRLGGQFSSTGTDSLQAPAEDCDTLGDNVRFVEFGRDETKAIWTPDLEVGKTTSLSRLLASSCEGEVQPHCGARRLLSTCRRFL